MADEAALQARAEQLERLLSDYARQLGPDHPLWVAERGAAGGVLTADAFRRLVEREVGDELQGDVFLRLLDLLPPVGDLERVDVRRWLGRQHRAARDGGSGAAPGAAPPQSSSEAVSARAELVRLMVAAGQERGLPVQQLLRSLEGYDRRGNGEVGVASFVQVLRDIGLGGTMPFSVNPIALLRQSVGTSGTVPYQRWFRDHAPVSVPAPAPGMIGPTGPAAPPRRRPSQETMPGRLDLAPDSAQSVLPSEQRSRGISELEKRDRWTFCRGLVHEAAAQAVEHAESRRAGRRAQNIFAKRPVIHAALTAEQRYSHSFSALVSQSLMACCCSLYRLILLEYGHVLRQLDLLSGAQLPALYIGPPPPRLSVSVLAMAVDDALAHLGTLDEKFTLALLDMKPGGASMIRGPYGVELARRQLPDEIPACKDALRVFNSRRYFNVGLGPSLLLFLEAPSRCFCLNLSWVGQIMLFDTVGLSVLRVLFLGGEPTGDLGVLWPQQTVGFVKPGLWGRCEASSAKGKAGAMLPELLAALLEEHLGIGAADAQAACLFARDGDACNFQRLCTQVDKARYPAEFAQPGGPALPPAASRMNPELQTCLSHALADVFAIDAFFEIMAVEHRGLLLATVGGLPVVLLINLVEGVLLPGVLRHAPLSARAGTSACLNLPPVLHVVASRDLVLTGGRSLADAHVKIWSLRDAPLVPSGPVHIFRLERQVESPVSSLSFLSVTQTIVDARLNGQVHIWDMTKYTHDIHDPAAEPHNAVVGGSVRRTERLEATMAGDSAPAVTLTTSQAHTTHACPVLRFCVPHTFSIKYDLMLAVCSTGGTVLRRSHSDGRAAQPAPVGCGPATLICWSVLRTRVHLPALLVDQRGLPQLLEPHVTKHANLVLERGVTDIQQLVAKRLKATLAITDSTGPRVRVARLARRSAVRCSLDFTWSPPSLPADLAAAASSMPPPLRTRRLVGVRARDVDELSLSGVGVESWTVPGEPCNFLQIHVEKRVRRAWMQLVLPPEQNSNWQGNMVRGVSRASRRSLVVISSAVGVSTYQKPKAGVGPHSSDGWFGNWGLSRGELGPGLNAIWQSGKGSPTNYGLEWTGQKWLSKVLRELRRLKMLDTHGHTLMLPLPLTKTDKVKVNPRKDGALIVGVGWKSITADAPTTFEVLREMLLLPTGCQVDDFLSVGRELLTNKDSVLVGVSVVSQFDRRLTSCAGGGEPSIAHVQEVLTEFGMEELMMQLFLDYLKARKLQGRALAAAVSERIAQAVEVMTFQGLRDLIGVPAGGTTLVDALGDSDYDWMQDVHSARALEALLAQWGIPLIKAYRKRLVAVLNSAVVERPESGGLVYSAATVMRQLYQRDEVALGLARGGTAVGLAIDRLDVTGAGVVDRSELTAALEDTSAHRVLKRLAVLSADAAVAVDVKTLVRYGPLTRALATFDAGELVLEHLATCASQATFVRLLSLFCGGLAVPLSSPPAEPSGADLRSEHGWTGLAGVHGAKRPPRLYGHEAIAPSDLMVVARSVAGLAIKEESLDLLVHYLDPEGHGSISTTRFLRCLHAGRDRAVKRAVAAVAALLQPSDELRDVLAAAAQERTMPVDTFVAEMQPRFPQLDRSLWPLIAEAFRASARGDAQIDVRDFAQEVERDIERRITDIPGAEVGPGPLTRSFLGATSDERTSLRTSSLLNVPRRGVAGDEPPPRGRFSHEGNLPDEPLRRIEVDLLSLVFGARAEILEACLQVDAPGFGTVSREEFQSILEKVQVVLTPAEAEGLVEFSDVRRDGLVPYRLVLHRMALALGRRSEYAESASHRFGPSLARAAERAGVAVREERFPARADISDLWRAVARGELNQGLDVRTVFQPPPSFADAGARVTRRVFGEAFERMGLASGAGIITLSVSDSSEGVAVPLAPGPGSHVLLPPVRPPGAALSSALQLVAGRDLIGAAFRELDPEGTGSVMLSDIERCVARARQQLAERQRVAELEASARLTEAAAVGAVSIRESEELTRGRALFLRNLPGDLVPLLGDPPNLSLATAIVVVASDLEAQQLSSFDAFACFDPSQSGVLRVETFCPSITAAVPAISLEQARALFEFMRSLPGSTGSEDAGAASTGIPGAVTFPQFERVFPLRVPADLMEMDFPAGSGELLTSTMSKGLWLETVKDRVVRHLNARGISPDSAWNEIDVRRTGAVTEVDFVQAASDLTLGISPDEARLLYRAIRPVRDGPGGASYRGFVGALQKAYDRVRAEDQLASGAATEAQAPPRDAAGADLVDAVGQRLHLVDPTLTRVFHHFALGGRLPRMALRDLLLHLGLRFSRAQLWLLWRELDPKNTGVCDRAQWQRLFHVTLSANVRWNTIFSRLEAACIARGSSLRSLLADLCTDTTGVLTPVVARRIFAKVGLATTENEASEWLEAVYLRGPGGELRVPIAHAAAATASRAHGGRLLAARRLQGCLRAAGITAEHALAIILRGRPSSMGGMPSIIARGEIVAGLTGLGIPSTGADLEQLLELLDPHCTDRILPETFLRVASPDEVSARADLARRGVAVPSGAPTAAQIRMALTEAGVPDEGAPPHEADLLVLALTAGGDRQAVSGVGRWFDEPSGLGSHPPLTGEQGPRVRASARALRPRLAKRGRWLLSMPIDRNLARAYSRAEQDRKAGLESRAEEIMRSLLNSVNWDMQVLVASLPPSPPLLAVRRVNEALRPLGAHISQEDVEVLRRVFEIDEIINVDQFVDVPKLLAAVRQIWVQENKSRGRTGHLDDHGYIERLTEKLRLRLAATGLDLVRSVALGRPVFQQQQDLQLHGPPSAPSEHGLDQTAQVFATTQLEEVLVAHPLSFTHKEAMDLVYVVGQPHILDGERTIDVRSLAAALAPRSGQGGFKAQDLYWVTQIHLHLKAAFTSCAAAFDFLDHARQGAVDYTHFCDGVMRVMLGSLPQAVEGVGVMLLDVGRAAGDAVVSAHGSESPGLARRTLGHFTPDTYRALPPLDPAQRDACTTACQRLFLSLSEPSSRAHRRQLRLLAYADFDRFWQHGTGALHNIHETKPVQGPKEVLDFWAAELLQMVAAKGDNLKSLVAALGKGGLSGQVPGGDLLDLVMKLMTFRFAPLLLSTERHKPLTDLLTIPLAKDHLATIHNDDLTCPLVLALHSHAQRLVHCALRGPLHPQPPLAAPAGDLTAHWAVDASTFVNYCSAAAAGTGKAEAHMIGSTFQLDADLANIVFKKHSVFAHALGQAHRLVLAVVDHLPASTSMELYVLLVAFRCLAFRLRRLQRLLVDMQMRTLAHAAGRVALAQMALQNLFPPPPPGPSAEEQDLAERDAGEALIRHLSVLQQLHLDDLDIDFKFSRQSEAASNRKLYNAVHPQVCWVTVERVDPGRLGRAPHQVNGFARFFAQPRPVVFRLDGDAELGVWVSEVLRGNEDFQAVQEQQWLLQRPVVPLGGVSVLLQNMRPGDTLVFHGSESVNMMAELVPKASVCEATVAEAAYGVLLSGRSGEFSPAAQLLKPEERSAATALAKARFSCVYGWRSHGDYALVKEPWSEDEWKSLHDVITEAGGLSRTWFTGGMYFFKLVCRQILSLMMLLHQNGVVARHLRLTDFLISRDGQQLRLQCFRFASLLDSSETMLPSLQGAKNDPLAPEFFAKGSHAATTQPVVDSWVFGTLAFHLFFGVPTPCFHQQLERFFERHPALSCKESKDYEPAKHVPAHFYYTPLAGVPPANRILLRLAVDKNCTRLKAPPRTEAAPGILLTPLLSHSCLAPAPPVQFRKVAEQVVAEPDPAGAAGPHAEHDLVDSDAELLLSADDRRLMQEEDVEVPKRTMVVVPEGHALDLVFACLATEQTSRPTLQQIFQSPTLDIESSEDGGWHLSVYKPTLEDFVDARTRHGVIVTHSKLEHMLRVICSHLFTQKSLSDTQQREYREAVQLVEILLLGESEAAAQSAMMFNFLYYLKFIALRTKENNPDMLKLFARLLSLVLEHLSRSGVVTGLDADAIIDIIIDSLCGREQPLDIPAHWRTRFFMRPRSWTPSVESADTVDELWRHYGTEMDHFGAMTYLTFSNHHKYLCSCLSDPDSALESMARRVRPLHAALKKRKVRGPTYLTALAEVAENEYRFYAGTSPVAKRHAVQHSRQILASKNLEQILALADMRVAEKYLVLLGSSEESVLEEVLLFYEGIEYVLTGDTEHCHAGVDCPACSSFRPHHTPWGVHLLSALALSPTLRLDLKQGAVRILIDVAKAHGLPPQRQALGTLVQLLQIVRPRDDILTTSLQPYTRKKLVEALHTPTPPLVHAMYCFPAMFTLLGIASSNVPQPASLSNVTEAAQAWLRRTQENARAQHGRAANWLAVLPLVAWTRHLAHLEQITFLGQAMDALLAIYKEAFIHCEMPHLPEPRTSGGLPPDTWDVEEQQVAAGQVGDKPHRIVEPARFMSEFLGLVEIIFLRFGPAPVKSSVARFVKELHEHQLMETPWYFQVLHLFGTVTAQKAPWLGALKDSGAKRYLQAAGARDKGKHPGMWTLAAWFQELHGMGLGRSIVHALQGALSAERALVRRPKWTATLLILLQTLWRNVVSVPAKTADALHNKFEEDGLFALLMECIGGGAGTPSSYINSSHVSSDRVKALEDMRAAAILFIEDVAKFGGKHPGLVQAIAVHVSRQFLEVQRQLLKAAPSANVRAQTTRLLRALLELKGQEALGLQNLLEEAGIRAMLSGLPEAEKEIVAPDIMSDHPLGLHQLQIGELIGGPKGPKPEAVLFPPSTTVTPAPSKPKPRHETVVRRQSRAGSRGPR